MSSYRATPEQWAMLEERSAPEYDNTILELRARVKALEANSKPTPNPSQIRSSLVERVRKAIKHEFDYDARAAIREVAAAALQMHPDKNLTWERVALWLEQEAAQLTSQED